MGLGKSGFQRQPVDPSRLVEQCRRKEYPVCKGIQLFKWETARAPTDQAITGEGERFQKIFRIDGIEIPYRFLEGGSSLQIPPDKKVRILIDRTYLTIGYPEMVVSGGKGSIIRMDYAEILYGQDRRSIGNRNDPVNKIFNGIHDTFLPDGGNNRIFRPLSHRAFRFIQLEI